MHYSCHPPFYLLYLIVKKAVKAFGSSSVPPQDTTAPPVMKNGVTATRRARQERFKEFRSCSEIKVCSPLVIFPPVIGAVVESVTENRTRLSVWMTLVKSVGCHSADSDDDEEQEKKTKTQWENVSMQSGPNAQEGMKGPIASDQKIHMLPARPLTVGLIMVRSHSKDAS